MKNRKNLILLFLAFSMLVLSLGACAQGTDSEEETIVYLYYKDAAKRELVPMEAVIDPSLSFDRRLASIWKHLVDGGTRSSYTSPVPSAAELKNYMLEDRNLIFNFSETYNTLPAIQEVLLRAALVKTFTQFPEVSSVEIRVESQPLTRLDGSVVGPERSSAFIDLFGSGLNAYTSDVFKLFYTNEAGDALVASMREITFLNTISPEQAVLEKLIEGPGEESLFATVSPDTRILSVSTRNGIAYVNLSSEFIKTVIVRTPEIAVYSIVNTLTTIPGIDAVQFSINGSVNVTFLDRVDLSKPLTASKEYEAGDDPE
ncbi:MAG: GerMN domain-containing protein [Lachnospiraceae bacterium]|nr:GerMN domain-containing protein [Lachnospiraceae bacterium]